MKIRIKGNSLRYRLTRPEVEQFGITGYIEEKINFGDSALFYALCRTDGKEFSASFSDNHITLYFPVSKIEDWASPDQVGFEHQVALEGSGEKLSLIVEKDFTCLDKVDEDQRDNYPNPSVKKSYA